MTDDDRKTAMDAALDTIAFADEHYPKKMLLAAQFTLTLRDGGTVKVLTQTIEVEDE